MSPALFAVMTLPNGNGSSLNYWMSSKPQANSKDILCQHPRPISVHICLRGRYCIASAR